MRKLLLSLLVMPLGLGCAGLNDSPEEGGANANDRTIINDGEEMLTGAMAVSPSGKFIVLQRNDISVIFDVGAKKYTELNVQLRRVTFAHASETAFANRADGTLAAIDLARVSELWSRKLDDATVSILRVGHDDETLYVGDSRRMQIVDPSNGVARSVTDLGTTPTALTLLKGRKEALVVGTTAWQNGAPHTSVALLDLETASVNKIDIPNCDSKVVMTPDESRAFLSPTFCDAEHASNPNQAWTNPDPVSVIALGAKTIAFEKNLPGFGPVAMSPDGQKVVAYLDTKRMDVSMFDKGQAPSDTGPQYHVMVINPKTLAFSLTPIGNALPRLTMTRAGKGLLVDASVKVKTRAKASAHGSISIGPNGISGELGAEVSVFDEQSPFGYFDLESLKFSGFTGPQAGLDRFVQLAGERYILTLEKRKDGLGGVPYLIDLQEKTTASFFGDFGTGVRDVGILPDGKTVVLRVRLAAATHENKYWSREGFNVSADFNFNGTLYAEYEASTSFANVTSTNDCSTPEGHDCF